MRRRGCQRFQPRFKSRKLAAKQRYLGEQLLLLPPTTSFLKLFKPPSPLLASTILRRSHTLTLLGSPAPPAPKIPSWIQDSSPLKSDSTLISLRISTSLETTRWAG